MSRSAFHDWMACVYDGQVVAVVDVRLDVVAQSRALGERRQDVECRDGAS